MPKDWICCQVNQNFSITRMTNTEIDIVLHSLILDSNATELMAKKICYNDVKLRRTLRSLTTHYNVNVFTLSF